MSGDGATVGLILGGAVMALSILAAVLHYRGKRKEEDKLFKARAAARIAMIKGSARSGASRPTGVTQSKKPETGKGKVNNYSNRHNTMPPQHPLPNAGFAPHISATGLYPATTFPGSHQSMAPTTVIPMTPITSLPTQPQQIHTFQDHMQRLQFSSHPRPTFVTTAYSTESGTSNVPVSYPGSSGAPQAVWQPTPFVPPVRPASNTGLPSHSAGAEAGVVGHPPGSSNATAFSRTTGIDTSQTNAVRDPNDSGTLSPAPPSPSHPPFVPLSTRPNQEIGSALSPHALLERSQNPQYVDEYHLH